MAWGDRLNCLHCSVGSNAHRSELQVSGQETTLQGDTAR